MLAHASEPPDAPLIAPLPPFVRFHFLRSRQIELRLDPAQFCRISRTAIVNLDAVTEEVATIAPCRSR